MTAFLCHVRKNYVKAQKATIQWTLTRRLKSCARTVNSAWILISKLIFYFCDKNPVHFWVTRIETSQSMLLYTKGNNGLRLIIQNSDLVNFCCFYWFTRASLPSVAVRELHIPHITPPSIKVYEIKQYQATGRGPLLINNFFFRSSISFIRLKFKCPLAFDKVLFLLATMLERISLKWFQFHGLNQDKVTSFQVQSF